MTSSTAISTGNIFISCVVPHAAVPHACIVGDLCLERQEEKNVFIIWDSVV